MKKNFLIVLVLVSFLSCSKSEDDNQPAESRYPKTVNIRFNANPAITNDAVVITTISNTATSHTLENDVDYPFNFTGINQIVNLGTGIKIRYTDDTAITSGPAEPWVDYDIILTIYVDEVEVKTETITLTQQDPIAELEYTFL